MLASGVLRAANSSTNCLDMVVPASLLYVYFDANHLVLPSVSLWAINFFFFFFFPFSAECFFSLCRIMPKARTRTSRQRQVGPAAGPSRRRASPRASVRASTAASAGAARGAPAGTTPNATPVTDGESHTQITPQEALLSSQFMETLVNRVAEEVSRRLAPAPTPPAPSPPVPTSDLQEVPAGPLADKTAPKHLVF